MHSEILGVDTLEQRYQPRDPLYFDVDIFAFWKSFDVGMLGFQKLLWCRSYGVF